MSSVVLLFEGTIVPALPTSLRDVIIRYLTSGLNSRRTEHVVLAARPRNLTPFFRLARELEDFEKDYEPFSSTNPNSFSWQKPSGNEYVGLKGQGRPFAYKTLWRKYVNRRC